MKATTTIGENGLLQGALSDEDLKQVNDLINNMNQVFPNKIDIISTIIVIIGIIMFILIIFLISCFFIKWT